MMFTSIRIKKTPCHIIVAIIALGVLSNANTVFASPPIPPKKTKTIESYTQKLQEEKKQKEKLKQKAANIESKIQDIKTEMMALGRKISSHEKDAKEIESRILKLEIRKTALENQLEDDRRSISRLILALERIRRTPPEAMIARPETPYKIAQSAMLMRDIIPSINKHAKKLTTNLETLNMVQDDLELDRKSAAKITDNLSQQLDTLKKLSRQHQELYNKTNKNIKISTQNIEKISKEAQNLTELVKRLKEQEKKENQERQKRLLAQKNAQDKIQKEAKVTLPPTNGQARFPVSGIIRTSYNQKDNTNAKSKGITFEARAEALVTAPMTGKISFTGKFKKYGNIIIIEHEGGYHSLIAGMGNITSNIGEIVKIGEPIGLLPKSTLNPHPTLYYELRKNGKPINPSAKFSDLG